jgi:hypothetical protein
MPDKITLVGLAISIGGLLLVLELVRRRKLREDYSLLWLATAVSLIVLSASRPLLDQFAALIGIVTYPPAALFLVAIVFTLFILLHFSTVLSRLTRENKEIAQQLALVRWELSETKKQLDAAQVAGQQHDQQQRGDIRQDDGPAAL